MGVWIVTTGSGDDGDEVQVQAVFSSKEKAVKWVQRWRVNRGWIHEDKDIEGQYDRYFEINDWPLDPKD